MSIDPPDHRLEADTVEKHEWHANVEQFKAAVQPGKRYRDDRRFLNAAELGSR